MRVVFLKRIVEGVVSEQLLYVKLTAKMIQLDTMSIVSAAQGMLALSTCNKKQKHLLYSVVVKTRAWEKEEFTVAQNEPLLQNTCWESVPQVSPTMLYYLYAALPWLLRKVEQNCNYIFRKKKKKVLSLLGLEPGPFGFLQTYQTLQRLQTVIDTYYFKRFNHLKKLYYVIKVEY